MRGWMIGGLLVGGCTFGRLDGLTGGSALDGADAAVVDAGGGDAPAAEVEAGSATDAAGVSGRITVLMTENFENTALCSGSSFNSTLTPSNNGHVGRACKVCGQGNGPDSFSYVVQVPGTVPTIGAHFHATAWYRSSMTSPAPPNVTLALQTFVPDPFREVEVGPEFGTPGADWQRLDTDLVVTKPAGALNVFFAAPSVANVCFIIDDLEVSRID